MQVRGDQAEDAVVCPPLEEIDEMPLAPVLDEFQQERLRVPLGRKGVDEGAQRTPRLVVAPAHDGGGRIGQARLAVLRAIGGDEAGEYGGEVEHDQHHARDDGEAVAQELAPHELADGQQAVVALGGDCGLRDAAGDAGGCAGFSHCAPSGPTRPAADRRGCCRSAASPRGSSGSCPPETCPARSARGRTAGRASAGPARSR